MIRFTKAHAYGNDFIYVRKDAAEGARPGGPDGPGEFVELARELCDRHIWSRRGQYDRCARCGYLR